MTMPDFTDYVPKAARDLLIGDEVWLGYDDCQWGKIRRISFVDGKLVQLDLGVETVKYYPLEVVGVKKT